jgi:hypothetical protein
MPYTEKQLAESRAIATRGEELRVELEAHGGKREAGTLRLLRLDPAARSARARKHLVVFLAIAPVAAVCPPHFVWTLAMIAVAVIGYKLRKARAEIVLGGEGRCPSCSAFQLLDGGNAEFPMAHICSECRRRSLVHLTDATAVAVS